MVIARWTARAGNERRVRTAIEKMIAPSRAEPSCRLYQPTVDAEHPGVFLLIEIYEDEAGYEAHLASEHFQRYAVQEALPLLEDRQRTFCRTWDERGGFD